MNLPLELMTKMDTKERAVERMGKEIKTVLVVESFLGSLAKGATATINVVVTVTGPSGAALTNTATVTATTPDLNSSDIR